MLAALVRQQGHGKAPVLAQSFTQNEGADLLMLGLDDPALAARIGWSDDTVRRLAPVLKADDPSVFATDDGWSAACTSPAPRAGSSGSAQGPSRADRGTGGAASPWRGPARR